VNPSRLVHRYLVDRGRKFRLADFDPGDTAKLGSEFKDESKALLRKGTERLAALQDKLYAQDRWALLLIFQAMDAAGKDGAIKHVMSGVNPQGCQVHSFKAPSALELDHDYLWRANLALPERGRIGIFNRSYYEEVLIVRVHRAILEAQKLPPRLVGPQIWKRRYDQINTYERYLAENGYVIRKFFLHVSKEEQKRRFLERLEVPEKNWKFEPGDVSQRKHWNDYMRAYEDAIRHTATPHAPWLVVPADNKWFTRLVLSNAIVDALESLSLAYPKVPASRRKALAAAREALLAE
jgi:PPK2 family polyphosphate:nucleotide phosphotransferase